MSIQMMNLKLPEIEVEKNKLLDVLRKNLKTHKSEYTQALKDRRHFVREKLTSVIEAIDANEENNPADNFHFPRPKDHSKEYEEVISMLSMDVNERVKLSHQQYKCLVLNEWDWQPEFDRLKLMYSASS